MPIIRRIPPSILGIGLAALGWAPPPLHGSGYNPDLFQREKMTEVRLEGLRAWLGQPVEVTAELGWRTEWAGHDPRDPQWAFIHLTPYLARFPDGNLIATYALDTDSNDNPLSISGYQISRDGGAHWGRRASVLMQHEEMVFLPQPDDSLLAVASEFVEARPGDARNFVGPTYLFENGGGRMLFTLAGARVVDWPWDMGPVIPGPQPRESWESQFNLTGNVIKVGPSFLATAYTNRKGDPADSYTSTLVSSEDGYVWRYRSTIARSGGVAGTPSFFDDANETAVVQLADGDLMAVFRTDRSQNHHLRRCYSRDQGRTWTDADILPAYSVFPQLLRAANGVIALSTGRPGIDLWLSADAKGKSWQKIDLMARHNQWAPAPNYRISSFPVKGGRKFYQTCSYTAMVEVAPNHLLIVYDRDAERAPTGQDDISRVFVLPVEIQRNG